MNDEERSGVQTLVVKSDQEASIMDAKNALMRELRSTVGIQGYAGRVPGGRECCQRCG